MEEELDQVWSSSKMTRNANQTSFILWNDLFAFHFHFEYLRITNHSEVNENVHPAVKVRAEHIATPIEGDTKIVSITFPTL